MKIAVFSDSHGSSEEMLEAVRDYMPDQIVFLGDGSSDLRRLEQKFPQIPICAVAGNCDYSRAEPEQRVIRLGSLKAFITHGHRYNVRRDPLALMYAAQSEGCQLAMFGHTHQAYYDQADGIVLLNPGSVGTGLRRWAKLEISPDGNVQCEIVKI